MPPNRNKIAKSTFQMLFQLAWSLLNDPKNLKIVSYLILLAELVINVFIIRRVKYTEIDWSTYMQQVSIVDDQKIYNYSLITGDTGPCVYPALHLHIYGLLRSWTDNGSNILRAQWFFLWIYLLNAFVVLEIYQNLGDLFKPWTLIPMFLLSHRIHSIFVLRLFNDPIAMLFMYLCIYFLSMPKDKKLIDNSNKDYDRKFILSTVFFTLALNTKMNILLFTPAFAYIYYRNFGLFKSAFHAIFFTGFGSILIGGKFLMTDGKAYLMAAFNFSRKFEYKWTVNWRFLSEDFFLDERLHLCLLICHVVCLVIFIWKFHQKTKVKEILSPQEIILLLFSVNLIGMAFSRSLHYQFLSWYHHTLPALVFGHKLFSDKIGLLVLGCIELCWNTYPSTVFSSVLLHVSHFVMLWGVFKWVGCENGSGVTKKVE